MKKTLISILCFLSMSINASSLEEYMASPDDIVGGHNIVDYANIWWQWTYTMPKELSPVRDLTGENCHQGQNGDVWFLAGGYGSSIISRTCEIPEGKYIFFPVINMLSYPSKQNPLTCEKAKASAALSNDKLLYIEIELNSIKASNPAHTRLFSENCFDLLGLVPKKYNAPKIYPSASDGYWVMLKPLPKGTHKLQFNAKYNRENSNYGKVLQHIQYNIIIK